MTKKPKGTKKMESPMAMMKKLQKLQEQIEEAQEQLAEETVEVTVGGGAVKVVMSGDQQCRSVEIAPALLEAVDIEMLQDLLLAAFNAALDRSREMAAERLGPLAGGMPL